MDWLKKVKQKIKGKELIQVDPSELRFPFLPNETMLAKFSIKLINITDNYVVFVPMVFESNVASYHTRPDGGILPPRSTKEFIVTRVAKKSVAESIRCSDKYILNSIAVSESFINSEYCSDLRKFYDDEQGGQIWCEKKLAVVLEQPHTEISSSVPEELIQVDPSELRFPFLPNEMLSASSSIKVVNVTDNYVVFITRSPFANVAWYQTRPYGSILPPRSTQELFVRRTAKKSVAQSIECDDKYYFYSTTVSESFSNSQYGSDLEKFYNEQVGQIWHRRELAVVLEPAYRQGSPDGTPHTEELIQVDPSELRFPFLPDERMLVSLSINLVNITDNYVVFHPRYGNTNVAEYQTYPKGAILPPRSTQEFLVRREAKKSVAQSIECDDKYIMFSTAVTESLGKSEYGSDLGKFYKNQAGQIWHRRELGVVLYPAYQQGSPDGMPKTEISSSAPEVDPSELRFPFLPNEMLSASSSIKIVNVTDNYVVFVTRSNNANVAWYSTYPDGGILPPRSTQELFLRRTAKKSVAQSIECNDKCIFYSTIVSESFSNSQYGSDLDKFYDEQVGQIWLIREMAVVLEPAYRQGSPEGISHTEELIQVDPSELRFPFLPDERMQVSFSIKLVNITDNYVAFHPRYDDNTNVAEYYTRPNGAILPPRSTQEFLVTRKAKKSVAQSIECDDKYIMFSTAVTESFSKSEYGSDLRKFYEKQEGQIWHRRELGVVLYPAYQQGYPDGIPETEELIQVNPHELRFPFVPDESISVTSLIKVVNITDDYIAFVQECLPSNVAKYTMTPSVGILPPRSTEDIVVRRTAKEGVLQSIECDDTNFLCSTIVSEDFKSNDLGKFYNTEAGVIWHKLELGVLLEEDTQLQPSEFMTHNEISSSARHELIQVDPNELRFPFLPNAMLSASSSIEVVNVTDNCVVFVARARSANVAWYDTRPDRSILPPRSTQEFLVRREVKKSVAQSIECNDVYILYSTTVSESFSNSKYCSDVDKFYNEQGGQIWHRRELGIVLYPAFQQGSPDGMPHTQDLIQVDPHELRFPFVPDESNSVKSFTKAVNITDDYIAFITSHTLTNVAEYTMTPHAGILSPRSTQDLVVTRRVKEGVLQSIECNDTNFLYSTIVSEDFRIDDLPKFYKTQVNVIWHKVKLGVLLEVDTQLQPSDFQPHTETESTLHHMPLQYMKVITNNFCNERILGRGGFGVVYKGVLETGKMVAVKKLVQSMASSQEQFENEINLLMKLKHPNIVQLLGYCYEMQHVHTRHEGKFVFAWTTECLLCLEYLHKGSLDKNISDASSGLDWPARLKIIEEISYGLQYLHEQSDGPIIHLDLKPANILLGENMTAKITDFGLSRLFDQKQTIQTANISGTLGYMPLENLRGIITPMSDIFSLGVIIMEELQKWRDVLQKEPGYTTLETDCQQIKRCIQIGLICVNPERTKRPTMKKIIDMLQGLESMDWYISNELSIQPQHPGGAAII